MLENNLLESSYLKIKETIYESRNKVYKTINKEMLECYFNVGKIIVELVEFSTDEVSQNEIIKVLSEKLTSEFGKGFKRSNLIKMKQFFEVYNGSSTLWNQLSWSHYRLLIKINDGIKREFYQEECINSNWNVRQLERQINSFYYERLISTSIENKEYVRNEINTLVKKDNKSIIKDPYILEFLDIKENAKFYERDLESNLIEHLQSFLLELRKRFLFCS